MTSWVVQVGEPISFVDDSGCCFRAEMLVNRLVERGHCVLRWTSTFNHVQKSFRFLDCKTITFGSRLRYRFLHGKTAYRKNISLDHFQHDRELADAFSTSLTEESIPDIILCSVPPLRLTRRIADYAHAHGIPLIVDIRDSWPDSLLRNLHFPVRNAAQWLLRHDRRRAKQIFYRARGVTAISSDCLRWGAKQADRPLRQWDVVFPMACEESPKTIFSSEKEHDEFIRSINADMANAIVTCIGRIGSAFDRKLTINLIRNSLKCHGRKVQFILSGDCNALRLFKKEQRDLPNLTVTGWLDKKNLNNLLAVTSIGLLPYKNFHSPDIRNKPLDFLSMGIPVISSLPGDFAELISQSNCGLSFHAGDEAMLHSHFERLLRSPQLRKTMGENGLRAFKEQFSANNVYGAFVDYLERFYRHHAVTTIGKNF
jgi:glycosyltransferase involved in cell wall biosynthesis